MNTLLFCKLQLKIKSMNSRLLRIIIFSNETRLIIALMTRSYYA